MGKNDDFGTPKQKKKSPHTTTFFRRSPRLMGKYKLPFSSSSTELISLSDDEVDLPKDASPIRNETIEFLSIESPVRVEDMNHLVEVEEFLSTEKQTQTQLTMHDFDLLFPISDLINGGGSSQLASSGVDQLINDDGFPIPLRTESTYKIPALDNLNAEEEYHSGINSDKESECDSLSFSESENESEGGGFERWDWDKYEAEEAAYNNDNDGVGNNWGVHKQMMYLQR